MVLIFLRSLLYNVLFYFLLILWFIVAIPTFVMPRASLMTLVRLWSRQNTWLLRVVCNVKVEYRGTETIPKGAAFPYLTIAGDSDASPVELIELLEANGARVEKDVNGDWRVYDGPAARRCAARPRASRLPAWPSRRASRWRRCRAC